jgi:putative ribosome biogenesis GTPase RsgA
MSVPGLRHEGEPGCRVQKALGDEPGPCRRFEHYWRLNASRPYQEQKRDLGAQMAEKTRWGRN